METAEEIYISIHNKYNARGGKPDRFDIEAMEEYAEQFKRKWISVDDRLPNQGQIIDVWNGNNLRSIFKGNEFERYVDLCNKDIVMAMVYMKVTHWVPLLENPLS